MTYPSGIPNPRLGICLLAPAQRIEVFQGVPAFHYAPKDVTAAVTFLVWDVLITLRDEVTYIWPSTQFYGAPLPLTYSFHGCYIWNVYQGLSSILVIAAVDYILILRVHAMYPRNKPVRYISSLLYVAELVMMSVGIGLAVPQLKYDERCVVSESPIVFTAAAAVRAGWGHVPIVQLLLRDGTWAFGLLFVVLTCEALLYGFAAGAYTGFLYGWLNTAFSICGYRIILNIHSTVSRTRDESNDNDIQFTSNICTSIPTTTYTSGHPEYLPMTATATAHSSAH
ncbi:hypothetical protein CC1G_04827 [Coprinopsis cinerea okayama7|uniref:DUF6533 domain-containing protein n=1 Tax=Coprinopsis cinerea (strain Okayama-7 / 130 / ATCC MYA-4618 / FGSC 9003) TaxID=240176 RepID=A8PFQ2_COPC7|nr:hypothetical protein CC1G_04827 [Coprinopsis cinerea okayama7\|eukprot:XP_001840983.2 hypothetical protein CC1G_04827 [Coprinopsis cinerea okayama7\